MTNAQAAEALLEMSVLLEFAGEQVFRVRAYQRAAQAVAAAVRPVAQCRAGELLEIPGVGKGIAGHLTALCATGTFPELEAMRKRFPAGLRELLRVPGLGPKRARFLHESAGVSGLEDLRKALAAGRLKGLKGFGPKLEEALVKGLEFAKEPERMLWWEARQLALELREAVAALPGVGLVEAAGSFRRGRETVGDLDLLCGAKDPAAAVAAFSKLPRVLRVLATGPTKASVVLAGGVQVDLRAVPPASFGAALQYFTGSKEHNVRLRERAQRRGLTVNEYGVFKLSDKKQSKPLAGRAEEEVYRALGLPFIPPELREDQGEIEAAEAGRLPRLVELSDVRGDFHNHSLHTDGRQSLAEMARAAKERGWEWVALGDHSKSLTVTNGLSVERLRATFKELEGVRKQVRGIELMRSMEVDILEDGRLDYDDEVLDEIDVVIASVHSRFKQPEAEMTRRICRAASSRKVDIIGHLSGRLINKRPAYELDFDAVARAAAAGGTALELNGQPDRQDLDAGRARRAREAGAPLAIDTDAHSTAEYAFMEQAVKVARRAWLEPKDLLNCLGYDELRRRLSARG